MRRKSLLQDLNALAGMLAVESGDQPVEVSLAQSGLAFFAELLQPVEECWIFHVMCSLNAGQSTERGLSEHCPLVRPGGFSGLCGLAAQLHARPGLLRFQALPCRAGTSPLAPRCVRSDDG